MNRPNNYHKAAIILIITAIGYLAAYPFSGSFWGGFAASLFGAAFIGGIVDWFSIAALFGKPLGIPFRTRLIPRNRNKIFDALVYMVENELLTADMVVERLEKFDFARILLKYLEENTGKQDLSVLFSALIKSSIDNIDPEELSPFLRKLGDDAEASDRLTNFLFKSIKWNIENDYAVDAIKLSLPKIYEIISSNQAYSAAQNICERVFKEIHVSSQKEKGGRGLILKALFALPGLSAALPGLMADSVIDELKKRISILQNSNKKSQALLKKKMLKYTGSLEKDVQLKKAINAGFSNLLKRIDWGTLINNAFLSKSFEERRLPEADLIITKAISDFVDDFKGNSEQQASFNSLVYSFLADLVKRNHKQIGKLVREKLETYEDEEIVNMVRSKAGNDLQIIRINGSVIGGLVGLLSFLLTYWL